MFDPAFPTTPAERLRVQNQLSDLFDRLGELREGFRNLNAKMDRLQTDVDGLKKKDTDDTVREATARGRRQFFTWATPVAAITVIGWVVGRALGWFSAVFAH